MGKLKRPGATGALYDKFNTVNTAHGCSWHPPANAGMICFLSADVRSIHSRVLYQSAEYSWYSAFENLSSARDSSSRAEEYKIYKI